MQNTARLEEADSEAAAAIRALPWVRDGLRAEDRERAARIFRDNFNELFTREPDGFRPEWQRPMRELLITWETG